MKTYSAIMFALLLFTVLSLCYSVKYKTKGKVFFVSLIILITYILISPVFCEFTIPGIKYVLVKKDGTEEYFDGGAVKFHTPFCGGRYVRLDYRVLEEGSEVKILEQSGVITTIGKRHDYQIYQLKSRGSSFILNDRIFIRGFKKFLNENYKLDTFNQEEIDRLIEKYLESIGMKGKIDIKFVRSVAT